MKIHEREPIRIRDLELVVLSIINVRVENLLNFDFGYLIRRDQISKLSLTTSIIRVKKEREVS